MLRSKRPGLQKFTLLQEKTSMAKGTSRRGFIKGTGMLAGGIIRSGMVSAGAVPETIQGTAGPSRKGALFRALLAKPDPLVIPVVNDVLTARAAELEGFEAVFTAGSWCSTARHGVPDLGTVTVTELVEYCGHIAAHTNLPVFAHGCTGGPTAVHIYRATQDFENAGVAAVMYDDDGLLKHLRNGKGQLVTKKQMTDKIKAAGDARKNQIVICARTVAVSEGYPVQDAIERGVAYAEAGADLIYFGGMSIEDLAKAKEVVQKPLMVYMTPPITQAQAKAAGGRVLYYHLEDIGFRAIHMAMKELKTTGSVENTTRMVAGPDVTSQLMRTQEWLAFARKYAL
jgi:2-methylisocitrate lyase-like PEP mutase family enzyme